MLHRGTEMGKIAHGFFIGNYRIVEDMKYRGGRVGWVRSKKE